MSFSDPWRLALLLVPVVLLVLQVVSVRRRTRSAVKFSHVDLLDEIAPRQPFRRFVPGLLSVLAMVSVVVALSHPTTTSTVERAHRRVVIAFDVSRSMSATDVSPSRFEVAKASATEFVRTAPTDVEIGLVLFSSSVSAAVPPTLDHDRVVTALNQAPLGSGTAVGDAVFASLDLLKPAASAAPASAVPSGGSVVVLSDGSTTTGRPDSEAIDAAKALGVPISTISFGTASGTAEINGETVPVPSDPEALGQYAKATGGTAATATDAAQLQSIFGDLSESVAPETVTRDWSDWFMLASLLLAAVAAGLSLRWFSRLA